MEYGVYLESSIVDLKPRILDFLTKIVDKAKEAKEYAIAFKKKDLAEIAGKDIRTTSRYLSELEERKIITTKGVRGRAGGTVIMFNAELIRFDTSDKAFINSDEPISIDDVVEQKLPKKQKEPKEGKRNRRTKQQMLEAEILKGNKQSELNKLNDKLIYLGTPNWAWFKETKDPVGNYRTYLLTRLYNRYAALFTDKHNAEISLGLSEGKPVPVISNDYDVLPTQFFGTSRWQQFEKFRLFCEGNGIDPAVYLSAQFNRSVFTTANSGGKKVLPFVNALMTDTSYDVFIQYCGFQKEYSATYRSYQQIPPKFTEDFVVRAIVEAYETADEQKGFWQYNYAIKDFLKGEGFGPKEEALLDFYYLTTNNLLDQKTSTKTRHTIRKFLLLQSMICTTGIGSLPEYVIFGSEMIQILLASISREEQDKKKARLKKERALGLLAYPNATDLKEIEKKGKLLYNRMMTLDETPRLLRLITERKGLTLSLADLNTAFKEYGKEKIPLDDYSILDVDKIVAFINKEEQAEINHEDITSKKDWTLEGALVDDGALEDALSNFLKDLE